MKQHLIRAEKFKLLSKRKKYFLNLLIIFHLIKITVAKEKYNYLIMYKRSAREFILLLYSYFDFNKCIIII